MVGFVGDGGDDEDEERRWETIRREKRTYDEEGNIKRRCAV